MFLSCCLVSSSEQVSYSFHPGAFSTRPITFLCAMGPTCYLRKEFCRPFDFSTDLNHSLQIARCWVLINLSYTLSQLYCDLKRIFDQVAGCFMKITSYRVLNISHGNL